MSGALYVGLISGTSMDGVDAVLADLENPERPEILAFESTDYPAELADSLARAAAGQALAPGQLTALDARIGEVFAAAASAIAGSTAAVTAIGSHGQNVYHGPYDAPPTTLQIGNPHVIAALTGLPVVADFRRRDVALGGQGAPLAPALHQLIFRSTEEHRAVLNLGGIANLTLLPSDPGAPVTGFDTGPGNCLMDEWTGRLRRQRFDQDGAWAASGRVSQPLLDCLLKDPYFTRPAPKSTGREVFNLAWMETHSGEPEVDAASVQATLCELTAATVANALMTAAPDTRRLLVAGGGVHNRHLMVRLGARLPGVTVESTAAHGVNPDAVEALLFAELARRAMAGQDSDLESVTGAPAHRYGVIFPA